jgi:raffinose/stachyose/melibiose transport system permease protein
MNERTFSRFFRHETGRNYIEASLDLRLSYACKLSMAAFVLAHLHFGGKKSISNYLALGLTFPFSTAVLPVFIRVRDLGLLDSYWGVILPQVAFNLGFAVMLLQGFFSELPNELFEASVRERL